MYDCLSTINFSLVLISSSILIALPLINLLTSLLEFSSFDRITRSTMFNLLSKSLSLIFIEGKLDPSELPEKASLADFSESCAAF